MNSKDKAINLFNYIKSQHLSNKSSNVLKYAEKYFALEDSNIRRKKVKHMVVVALRQLKRYDEAINMIEKFDMKYDSYFLLELFYIYYYLNMYDEALKLLPFLYEDDEKAITNYALNITELIMRKELGLDIEINDFNFKDYTISQITNYDKELALDHISEHQYNKNFDNRNGSCFNKKLDTEYLFDVVQKNLLCSTKQDINDVLEIHYFGVSNIGFDQNNICNYIRVVVVPNTLNIISLYPVAYLECDDIPLLKCDYNKLYKNNSIDSQNIKKFIKNKIVKR